MYISPFSNACHLLKTNAPPTKNPKMTSLTLRPTYPISTTNFKSTTLLLKSGCGEGIQLKGTCRYGPGQLPSTRGYKPRTRAAIPLPPLVVPRSQGNARSRVLPGDSRGSVPRFCQRCTRKRKKTVQSWENLFKACRWETALSRRVQCIYTKRLYARYF